MLPRPADTLLAAALFVLTLGPGHVLDSGDVRYVLLQIGLTAPLAWRRRAPLTVFLVIAAAAGVQWSLDVQLPADAALLVALYTVAGRTRWTVPAALILEAGVLLAATTWAPRGQLLSSAAAMTAMTVAAVATGLWTRSRRAALEDRARLAVAEERARMTRDVHDIVTHNLSVMVALADSADHVRHRAPEQAAAAVRQIASTGRQALADMRRTLTADPAERADPGEPAQPVPGIGQLAALAGRLRAAGVPTRLEVRGDTRSVPAAAQLTVYRLAQEALTNVFKHAPGAAAEVLVDLAPGRVAVRVSDDGTPAGRGLTGMSERVAAYGGTFHAGPVNGGGWRVSADFTTDEGKAP